MTGVRQMEIDRVEIVFYLCLLLFWVAVFSFIGVLKAKNNIEQHRIQLDYEIDTTVPETLDKMIMESFEEYMILNESFNDVQFLSRDMEEKISHGVNAVVSRKLSDIFKIKLATYYNEENIPEIIAQKIYILVMNYSIKTNGIKDDEE